MKVAIAQINPTVGDIEGNADKIVQNATRAKELGSDLVVFPEMALTGYPPCDLLLRSNLVERTLAALNDIGQRTTAIPCIIGYVDKNPLSEGKPLYNAAAILEEGQIQYITYKSHLPRHDYFDQTRYFEPAVGLSPTKFKDKRIAITIGEDLWDDASTGLSMGFANALLGEISKKKVELVINLSASPYAVGLDHKRVEILKKQATTWKVPILMCNQVGGNDELVFDGSSVCISAAGEVIARGKAFQEDLIFVDLDYGAGDIHEEDRPDNEMIYRAVIQGIRDYATKCGFKQAALLLSGSLESSVAACAASEALGKENVLGVALSGSAEEARQLASTLGMRVESLETQRVAESALGLLGRLFAGRGADATEGNLQARLGSAVLMAISNKLGFLPLSTMNRSDLMSGNTTVYGDLAFGLAPLADIPRSTLLAIAQEVVNRDKPLIPASILNRAGGDYSTLDQIIKLFVDEAKSPEEIVAAGIDDAAVQKAVERIEASEFKRRQRPISLRVVSNLLKPVRQMPIARKR